MTAPISDLDLAELYAALGKPVQAAHFRSGAEPDPDAVTVGEVIEAVEGLLDQVPEPSTAKSAKHNDTCWKRHTSCLAELIRELLDDPSVLPRLRAALWPGTDHMPRLDADLLETLDLAHGGTA